MLTAQKMDRVTAIVLRSDADRVLNEVARLGVMHPVHNAEIDEWANELLPTDAEHLTAEYAKRRLVLQQLLDAAPTQPSAPPAWSQSLQTPLDLDHLDDSIKKIQHRIEPLRAAYNTVLARKNALTVLRDQVSRLLPANVPFPTLFHSLWLLSAIGAVNASCLPALQAALAAVPSIVLPFGSTAKTVDVLCVVLKRDKDLLDQALRGCGFQEATLPQDLERMNPETQADIARELVALESDVSRVTKDLSDAQAATLPEVRTLVDAIDETLTSLTLKGYCCVSVKTCVLTGWVPRALRDRLVAALQSKTSDRALVEVEDAETLEFAHGKTVDIPVLLEQPAMLRPFQILVGGFGVPTYHMLDPTLFAAITFLFMFGMMFGDVGHGLILMIFGAILLTKYTRFADVGRIVVSCGASSITFGFLYGSVFGLESLFPPLWAKPLENVYALFKFAIAFGVCLISLGLILNIANTIRRRTFARDLFEVSGPLTAIAYWAALGLVIRLFASSNETYYGPLLWLVALPLAAFFAKGPALAFAGINEKAFPEGFAVYVMETAVKILEVMMGCLANTVSFIRVAAFGLAHAGLFIAIFGIADAIPAGRTGAMAWWLVLIAGNIVVIVLEGVVVTIQALRLEYYEFFSKFFSTTGTKYQPVAFSKPV